MNSPFMNSPLLIPEYPLQVLPSLAAAIGLNEAIVIQQVHYWVEHNRRSQSERHFREGRWWTFNTIAEWEKQFPFWSGTTIGRIFRKLESQGLLFKGEFGKNLDKTRWSAIDYESLNAIVSSWHIDQVKLAHRSGQVGIFECAKLASSDFANVASSSVPSWQNDLYTDISSETTDLSLRDRASEIFSEEDRQGEQFPEALIEFVASRNPGTDRPRAYALTLLKNDRTYWELKFQQHSAPPPQPSAAPKLSPDPPLKPPSNGEGGTVPPPSDVDPRQSAIAKAQSLADAIVEGNPMAQILAQQVARICEQWAIPYPDGFTPTTGDSGAEW